jgi:hypothetical protein
MPGDQRSQLGLEPGSLTLSSLMSSTTCTSFWCAA